MAPWQPCLARPAPRHLFNPGTPCLAQLCVLPPGAVVGAARVCWHAKVGPGQQGQPGQLCLAISCSAVPPLGLTGLLPSARTVWAQTHTHLCCCQASRGSSAATGTVQSAARPAWASALARVTGIGISIGSKAAPLPLQCGNHSHASLDSGTSRTKQAASHERHRGRRGENGVED